MSDQSTPIKDDDLANEAPPGYRSQKHRERYVPLMATLLVGTFLLEMIVPMIIFFGAVPAIMMGAMSQSMPEFGKSTAWQGAIWYPTQNIGGGGRNGCQLKSSDYQGKSLDRPAIEVDTQPSWLLADGDRLWAVSPGEVAEIYADGSRPVVMHPARFLSNASHPFLYEGRLAVADSDDNGSWSIFTFEQGEWNHRIEHDFSAISPPQSQSTEQEEAPADA
jgi:hypothetical protein